MKRLGALVAALAVAFALTVEAASASVDRPRAPGAVAAVAKLKILVLSNRADLISGDDALVQIVLPRGVHAGSIRVDDDGRDVTSAFARRADGRFLGRVEGLALGPNVLTARKPDGTGARITITNHGIGGPVISGPQVQPWLCTTQNNGLGPAQDAQCNAPTVYQFFYMPTSGGGFQPYNPASPPPAAAIKTTTTDQGKTVPYIIRQETGTQNRGIYRIAVLFEPGKPWEPWAPQQGWNRKLFLPFGASCGYSHSQSAAQNVQNDTALSRGFMVSMSSLNVLGNNCNTTTSAESAMMMKERIVERYGQIRYTFSEGCSGGSISQHEVANAYPGLLQGLRVSCSYEDMFTGAFYEVYDCHMLIHYFTSVSPQLWLDAIDQRAVTGQESTSTCASWDGSFGASADPTGSSPNPTTGCGLDASQMYDPATNPSGCRGTFQDFNVSIVGRRPESIWTAPERAAGLGFARLAYDNVGVEYGLEGLEAGEISPEQFVDLNEKIGGLDIDYTFIPRRSVADPGAVANYYRGSRANDTRQLDQVAIIDERLPANAEFHTAYHSWALKERLRQANGQADNQVVWTNGSPPAGSFLIMDQWLSAVEADTSADPLEVKIVRNKPAGTVDACFVGNQMITDLAQCRTLYPYYGSPRVAASGLLRANGVLKCQLKPLNRADYSVTFTNTQWARLQAAFPGGVCDWTKPSLDQVPSVPWLTYKNGPGGQPLGPVPVSKPI